MTTALVGLAVLALGLGLALVIRNYRSFRATRLIVCPETGEAAAVKLDAARATETSVYQKLPDFRLSACSRWPERQDCDQDCLRQIEADPQETLVRKIVERWYEGQVCALCRQPIRDLDWSFHTAALAKPGFATIAWTDIKPENLPTVLDSALPVCWSCHLVESFRREHPELIIDRRPAAGHGH